MRPALLPPDLDQAALPRALWRQGVIDVVVLHSEFDAHGYDLIMARGRIVRHIQFKTGSSKTLGPVSVSQSLAEKLSGCLIWIRVKADLEMGSLFWFGGMPGGPPPLIADYPNPLRPIHNKAGIRPPRQHHRAVPGIGFRELGTLSAMLEALFGTPLSDRPSA